MYVHCGDWLIISESSISIIVVMICLRCGSWSLPPSTTYSRHTIIRPLVRPQMWNNIIRLGVINWAVFLVYCNPSIVNLLVLPDRRDYLSMDKDNRNAHREVFLPFWRRQLRENPRIKRRFRERPKESRINYVFLNKRERIVCCPRISSILSIYCPTPFVVTNTDYIGDLLFLSALSTFDWE